MPASSFVPTIGAFSPVLSCSIETAGRTRRRPGSMTPFRPSGLPSSWLITPMVAKVRRSAPQNSPPSFIRPAWKRPCTIGRRKSIFGHAATPRRAKKGVPADEIRKIVDFAHDGEVLDPAGRLHHDYRHVTSDIRRRVIRHQKERESQTRRQERQSPKNQPSPDVIDDQLDLF